MISVGTPSRNRNHISQILKQGNFSLKQHFDQNYVKNEESYRNGSHQFTLEKPPSPKSVLPNYLNPYDETYQGDQTDFDDPFSTTYEDPFSLITKSELELQICTNNKDSASGFCEHGRRRSRCKDCGGTGICKHGRQRYTCKACGGPGICKHGRQRYLCKICGGSGLCEHSRVRSQCVDCGGTGICKHGRRRSRCKDCGGSGICKHGRVRSQCTDCGGSGVCRHKRRRYTCKACGGKGICEHGRHRSRCKECKECVVSGTLSKNVAPAKTACSKKKIADKLDLSGVPFDLEPIMRKRSLNSCSSRFKGITRIKDSFVAYIYIDGKRKHLGTYKNESEAAVMHARAHFKLSRDKEKLEIGDVKSSMLAPLKHEKRIEHSVAVALLRLQDSSSVFSEAQGTNSEVSI